MRCPLPRPGRPRLLTQRARRTGILPRKSGSCCKNSCWGGKQKTPDAIKAPGASLPTIIPVYTKTAEVLYNSFYQNFSRSGGVTTPTVCVEAVLGAFCKMVLNLNLILHISMDGHKSTLFKANFSNRVNALA